MLKRQSHPVIGVAFASWVLCAPFFLQVVQAQGPAAAELALPQPAEPRAPDTQPLLNWPEKPIAHPLRPFSIGEAHLSVPEDDSFRMVADESEFPGQVVYSLATSPRTMVFRSLGRTRRLRGEESNIAWYDMAYNVDVFAPHWYPRSQDIYFYVGDANIPGSGADAYLWHLESGKVDGGILGTMQIRTVNWAPSGRWATYLTSGRDERGDLQSQLVISGESSTSLPDISVIEGSWLGDTYIYAAQPEPTPTPRKRKPRGKSRALRGRKQLAKAPQKKQISSAPVIRECLYTLNFNRRATKNEQRFTHKLLVKDGFKPSVSPDKQWMTYTGWLTTNEQGTIVSPGTPAAKERFGLCVFEFATGKRHWLRPGEYSAVHWLPDSRQILLVDRGGYSFYKLSLNQLLQDSESPNTVAPKLTPFARYGDDNLYERAYTGFSHNGRSFFFKASQTTEPNLYHRSLQALDLTSGEVKTVFEWTKSQSSIEDFDWLDESLPPTVATNENVPRL